MTTQLENKLEPCPFCGRKMIRSGLDQPHWQQWWEHEDRETSQCVLKNQTISDTSKVYKAAWNSRAPVVAPQEGVLLALHDAFVFYAANYHDDHHCQNFNPVEFDACDTRRCVRARAIITALLPKPFRPMCDDPDCWVCKRMAEYHAAPSPSSPVPAEQKRHEFLQFPLGRFRNPKDDIGKCWHVVNMLYCGLPADAEVHQPAATPAPVEQERRHRKLTHEDDQRLQEAFDSLPECPTEEEAEAVLQLCGTSGKEVVNGFIERLLKDRSEMQAEIDRLRTTPSPSLAAREAAEEIVSAIPRLQWSRGIDAIAEVEAIISRYCSPVPAAGGDESKNAWSKWFDRLGDKASADVVNATADLVTDERLAALVQAGVLPKADSQGEEGK